MARDNTEQNDIIERTHTPPVQPGMFDNMIGASPTHDSYCMLSPCEKYRYMLMREWDTKLPLVNFVMLNPSTATELENDPTMSGCIRRAKKWNYGGLIVTNLFAFRATDPKELSVLARNQQNPIEHAPGYNENAIATAVQACDNVICAWGNHGELFGRGMAVKTKIKMILDDINPQGAADEDQRGMYQLGINAGGHPSHPLYLNDNIPATRIE